MIIRKYLLFHTTVFLQLVLMVEHLGIFYQLAKESLAQFYIYNEVPDSPVCDNYFRVTDTEALKAFYKGTKVGRTVKNEVVIDKIEGNDLLLSKVYKRHRRKTSFNYIARNFIWDSNRWKSQKFIDWIDEFKPDILLLQIGDFSFMFKISMTIAKERNIPIVLYNSEDYYFKNKQSFSPLYYLYRSQYVWQFETLMSYASHTIYICDKLQDTYNRQFNHESTVLMTATNMVPLLQDKKDNDPFVVSYLGNLGLGRHESLIDIAKTLQEIDPNLYLDVYGKIPTEYVKSAFENCTGIRYKGLVSYQEVIQIMQKSDLLVHAENFSEFSKRDLKHAFSTKIADCLASGTCFLSTHQKI